MGDVSYETLFEKHPETVVFQLRGKFYHALDDSAFVLKVLCDYKVKRLGTGKCRAGFPMESLDKVFNVLESHRVNVVAYDGENLVKTREYENNQFNEVLQRFSPACIEEKGTQIKKSETEHCAQEASGAVTSFICGKQRISFVQGQGITLENAIMDIQRAVERLMEQGRRINSVSFIENRGTGAKDVVLVQGLVVYEITEG